MARSARQSGRRGPALPSLERRDCAAPTGSRGGERQPASRRLRPARVAAGRGACAPAAAPSCALGEATPTGLSPQGCRNTASPLGAAAGLQARPGWQPARERQPMEKARLLSTVGGGGGAGGRRGLSACCAAAPPSCQTFVTGLAGRRIPGWGGGGSFPPRPQPDLPPPPGMDHAWLATGKQESSAQLLASKLRAAPWAFLPKLDPRVSGCCIGVMNDSPLSRSCVIQWRNIEPPQKRLFVYVGVCVCLQSTVIT